MPKELYQFQKQQENGFFDVGEVVKEGEVKVAKVIKVEEDKKLVHLSLKRVSKLDEKEK